MCLSDGLTWVKPEVNEKQGREVLGWTSDVVGSSHCWLSNTVIFIYLFMLIEEEK